MYRERRAESEDSLAIRGGGLHGYLRFLKNVIDPILISRGLPPHALSLLSLGEIRFFPSGSARSRLRKRIPRNYLFFHAKNRSRASFVFLFFLDS